MLKASLTSFFTNLDDQLAVSNDRVELCEMCIRVSKYAYLLTNHPSTSAHDFETAVASHACSAYHERREDDCITLSHATVRASDYANAQFTPAELNLSVEDLRTLVVSKSDQRCSEMSCCGSKIYRRQHHPRTNGQLQPEDIDAEAGALAKQEMELVNQRSEILKQKLALDDHLSKLRQDASMLEKTKKLMRERHHRFVELEHRLKHREERLQEKEQDLSERQKLMPYYLPYPMANQPPPAQQQQQQQQQSAGQGQQQGQPAPSDGSTSTTNSNSQQQPAQQPSSSLYQRRRSSLEGDMDYDDADLDASLDGMDPMNDLNADDEEQIFLTLLQGARSRRQHREGVASQPVSSSDDVDLDALS